MNHTMADYDSQKYISRIENLSIPPPVITAACLVIALLLGINCGSYSRIKSNEPKGCRRLGLETQSNISDEHHERYSKTQKSDKSSWIVKSLWIYPVKSCRGVELDTAGISGRGMQYDRQFSFAQLNSNFPASPKDSEKERAKHQWKFITQRTFAAMANIRTEIWIPDPSSPTYSKQEPNVQSQGVIVIKFPAPFAGARLWQIVMDMLILIRAKAVVSVHIPFYPTEEQISANNYRGERMEIWKDNPESLLITSTEDDDSWIHHLRTYLGITNQLALFRVGSGQPREVYRCAPRREELGYQSTVGFQDAYPLHILNLASVHDVAKNMQKGAPPIGARNFRPNIVISGGDAYAEDAWKRITIGGYVYYVASRTVRCLLPNVNPATGIRHGSEPNRTLKEMRRIDAGDPKNACLGMQMVPATEESVIRVGDELAVLETGEHFYLKQ